MPFLAKNGYFEPENEKSDLNSNSTSNILLEMTHSWFLAIFGLPRTIFVKVVAILSSNFYFGQIFTKSPFLPKTPRKTAEKKNFAIFAIFSQNLSIFGQFSPIFGTKSYFGFEI